MAKKRRLSKAEKQKRENFKWVFMFAVIVITITVYLASFVEVDKTQSSIDFNKKTLTKLDAVSYTHLTLPTILLV